MMGSRASWIVLAVINGTAAAGGIAVAATSGSPWNACAMFANGIALAYCVRQITAQDRTPPAGETRA